VQLSLSDFARELTGNAKLAVHGFRSAFRDWPAIDDIS